MARSIRIPVAVEVDQGQAHPISGRTEIPRVSPPYAQGWAQRIDFTKMPTQSVPRALASTPQYSRGFPMSIQRFAQSVLITAALAVAGTALATGNGMPKGVKVRDVGVQATIGGSMKLLKTVTGTGNGNGTPLTLGFNTVDERVINCTVAAGCAIGIESMGQIKPMGSDWAICLLIDGASVSCQYQGIQGSTSGWAVGNARGVGLVTQGNHTVTTQLYTEASTATYAFFSTDYRLYK